MISGNNLTCGEAIRNARNLKEMAINDLAFKMSKSKEHEEVREYERKIDLWEKGRDNPNLDEIYLLAEILELNPTELKELRDNPQKKFVKTYKDDMKYKAVTEQLKDTLSDVIYTWGKLALIFAIILFLIYAIRLFNRSVDDIQNVEEHDYSENAITEYMNSVEN